MTTMNENKNEQQGMEKNVDQASNKNKDTLKNGIEKVEDLAEAASEKGKDVLETGTEKSGDALKIGAEKLGEFVKVGAEKVGEFASQTAELAKEKLEVHHLSSELNKLFQKAGEKVWRLHQVQKLNEVETYFSDEFDKIAKIEEALEENRTKQ